MSESENSKSIDIKAHPYVEHLLSTGEYEVDQGIYTHVSEHLRSHSLTASTLKGADMIATDPFVLKMSDDLCTERGYAEVYAFYHLGGKLCGHEGIIHGGLLATLVDETLCWCGFKLLPNKVGVTASLNLQYVAPTPARNIIAVHAKTTKVDGRKAWVEGNVILIPDTYSSPEDIVDTVRAEVLVIEPKWAKSLNGGKEKSV